MGQRDLFFLSLLVAGAGGLAATLAPPRAAPRAEPRPAAAATAKNPIVAAVDAALRARWREAGVEPAPRADDLARLRRASLALTGTIPSLAAIRRFEALSAPDRLAGWVDDLLADPRASDYLAERLARAAVGTEDGPFLAYRRRRLVAWLSDELHRNRPYDALVRDLIAGHGPTTDQPATNFIAVTYDPDKQAYDPERLAARVARAFLGVRIDCAQCHDHPFEPWKQADFRGLAAFFGQVQPTFTGVNDGAGEFEVRPRGAGPAVAVAPRAPFLSALDPGRGTRRERLAAWVTDPRNDHFARATANRAWDLLFGRPLVEPIDDLGGAGVDDPPPALTLLADDFARSGFDFRRLLRTIAATEAFALSSATAEGDDEDEAGPGPDADAPAPAPPGAAWAAFPIGRLRPEQVAGGLMQAASTGTVDANSHLLVRLATFGGITDFVARHGDLGQDEFAAEATSTIPQRLLLMNGELVRKNSHADIVNLAGRLAAFAPDDARVVEVAYLATLTRRPTPAEAAHFEARLAGRQGDARSDAVTDLLWVLLNTTEFSYNH